MITTLLPCPFCGTKPTEIKKEGGSDERFGYNFHMVVQCPSCHVRQSAQSSQDKNGWCNDKGYATNMVAVLWNTRMKTGGGYAVVFSDNDQAGWFSRIYNKKGELVCEGFDDTNTNLILGLLNNANS